MGHSMFYYLNLWLVFWSKSAQNKNNDVSAMTSISRDKRLLYLTLGPNISEQCDIQLHMYLIFKWFQTFASKREDFIVIVVEMQNTVKAVMNFILGQPKDGLFFSNFWHFWHSASALAESRLPQTCHKPRCDSIGASSADRKACAVLQLPTTGARSGKFLGGKHKDRRRRKEGADKTYMLL